MQVLFPHSGGAGAYLRDFQGRTLEGVQAVHNQIALMFEGNGKDNGIALIVTSDGDHIHIAGVPRPVTPNSYGHKIFFPCERVMQVEPMPLFEPLLPGGDVSRN